MMACNRSLPSAVYDDSDTPFITVKLRLQGHHTFGICLRVIMQQSIAPTLRI